MQKFDLTRHLAFSIVVIFLMSCAENKEHKKEKKCSEKEDTTITVSASAYNPVAWQTKNGNIGLAAWGDTLKPGVRAIAVSRDLIKMGLTHNKKVQIEGLDSTYVVKDKMNRRWKKKIDIYMGNDLKAAREWGIQQVDITFNKKYESGKEFADKTNDKE